MTFLRLFSCLRLHSGVFYYLLFNVFPYNSTLTSMSNIRQGLWFKYKVQSRFSLFSTLDTETKFWFHVSVHLGVSGSGHYAPKTCVRFGLNVCLLSNISNLLPLNNLLSPVEYGSQLHSKEEEYKWAFKSVSCSKNMEYWPIIAKLSYQWLKVRDDIFYKHTNMNGIVVLWWNRNCKRCSLMIPKHISPVKMYFEKVIIHTLVCLDTV